MVVAKKIGNIHNMAEIENETVVLCKAVLSLY